MIESSWPQVVRAVNSLSEAVEKPAWPSHVANLQSQLQQLQGIVSVLICGLIGTALLSAISIGYLANRPTGGANAVSSQQ
jgi:hypothetical protein